MARKLGASEWQLAYRYQNAFEAKRRAMVELGCEPWEVEVAAYSADANQPVPREKPYVIDETGTLEKLMSSYPIGDGQHSIGVYRLLPKSYGGYLCAGPQVPITVPMTMADFVHEYGGGEYVLTVYGPARRGSTRLEELEKVGPLVVPYVAPFGAPPNPEAKL